MKFVSVVGARPQFIKAAAISRAIAAHNAAHPEGCIEDIILHTGQHYDENMSQVFFDELAIPAPRYNLGIGSLPHGAQTGRMLEAIERVLMEQRPDWVVVHGDTNSTLAGALAARKLNLLLAHVEAGLRSFNCRMPEEINRVLADHMSDFLFCPTDTAVRNLHAEGIERGVKQVGDVMFDAALFSRENARASSRVLQTLGLKPREFVLATVHRAENTDDTERLASICKGLACVANETPVILALHPRTRKLLAQHRIESILGRVRLIAPVPYFDMIRLEESARAICTDSGGVQKEAFFFGVPCITLRDETEWVETVEAGWNTLIGADSTALVRAIRAAADLPAQTRPPFYGDGKAAENIVKILLRTVSVDAA
jgi:UDP-GlcNAc3NAcA epimerase